MCTLNCSHINENNSLQFKLLDYRKVGEIYLGLEELYAVFSNEAFLLIFWLHFLSINLFVGNWIASDSQIYSVPRFFSGISLLTTYFTGPLGLVLYWFVRTLYSKKINFYD